MARRVGYAQEITDMQVLRMRLGTDHPESYRSLLMSAINQALAEVEAKGVNLQYGDLKIELGRVLASEWDGGGARAVLVEGEVSD